MKFGTILGIVAAAVAIIGVLWTLLSEGKQGEKGDPPSTDEIRLAIADWARHDQSFIKDNIVKPVVLESSDQLKGDPGRDGSPGAPGVPGRDASNIVFKTASMSFRYKPQGNDDGRSRSNVVVSMPTDIAEAHAVIRGYRTEFTEDNRQIKKFAVFIDRVLVTQNRRVSVDASVVLSDKNGDDPYTASVDILVIGKSAAR